MNDRIQEANDVPDLNEFYDPRLVAIYDSVNPIAEYEKFYLDLASKLSASSVIDIGCFPSHRRPSLHESVDPRADRRSEY